MPLPRGVKHYITFAFLYTALPLLIIALLIFTLPLLCGTQLYPCAAPYSALLWNAIPLLIFVQLSFAAAILGFAYIAVALLH